MRLLLYMGKGRVFLVIVADFSGVWDCFWSFREWDGYCWGWLRVGAEKKVPFQGSFGFGLRREVGGIGYRWEEENKNGESYVPAVGMGNDFWVYASGADDDENE